MRELRTLFLVLLIGVAGARAQRLSDDEWKRCFQKLGELVVTTPDPSFQNFMTKRILSGELKVEFSDGIGLDDPSKGIVTGGSFGCARTRSGDLVPFLNVARKHLLDPNVPNQSKQLGLWHEYDHMCEYYAGRGPEWALQPMTDAELAALTPEKLRELFEHELHAYVSTAYFAVEHGLLAYYEHGQAYTDGGVRGVCRLVAENYELVVAFDKVKTRLRVWADEYAARTTPTPASIR